MAGLITASVLIVGTTSNAHEKATGIIKECMLLAEKSRKSMKALARMMRRRDPFDTEKVRALARNLAVHGSANLTKLYPGGSLQNPSEARPKIWRDWKRFSALVEQLTDYAKGADETADNGKKRPSSGAVRVKVDSDRVPTKQHNTIGPTPENSAQLSADVAFKRIARTFSDCHREFRREK